jgi:hypothetical protein
MFRFSLVSADGTVLGSVPLARRVFQPGDLIPSGIEQRLRVVQVIEPDGKNQLPVLVVELAAPREPVE